MHRDRGGADDTHGTPPCLRCETSQIDDHADLVSALSFGYCQPVQGGGLDDPAQAMATGVQLLAVERPVDHRLRTRVHLHAVHDDALCLVEVEALVDPGGKEPLR